MQKDSIPKTFTGLWANCHIKDNTPGQSKAYLFFFHSHNSAEFSTFQQFKKKNVLKNGELGLMTTG